MIVRGYRQSRNGRSPCLLLQIPIKGMYPFLDFLPVLVVPERENFIFPSAILLLGEVPVSSVNQTIWKSGKLPKPA